MDEEIGIRERLRDSLSRGRPTGPPPDLAAIVSRARHLRARRYVLMGTAGILLAAAVALPVASLAGLLRLTGAGPSPVGPGPSVSRATLAPSASIPDVVGVTCDAVTHLDISQVAAQPDGVHFRTNGTLQFRLPQNTLPFGLPGVPEGSTVELVFPIPPGPVGVLCLGLRGKVASVYEELVVVDPAGFWIPADRTLDCPTDGQGVLGEGDYATPPPGGEGDPVDVVGRYADGLQPTDRVEPAGYPEAPTRVVRIVRGDRIVTWAQLVRNDDGRWVWGDPGFGICQSDIGFGSSPLGWSDNAPLAGRRAQP
jgi:hypothetical protein